jgi:hypothetical protein
MKVKMMQQKRKDFASHLSKMTEAELDKFVDINIDKFSIVSGSAWDDASGDKELKIQMILDFRMDYDRCKCGEIFCTLNWTRKQCHICIWDEYRRDCE